MVEAATVGTAGMALGYLLILGYSLLRYRSDGQKSWLFLTTAFLLMALQPLLVQGAVRLLGASIASRAWIINGGILLLHLTAAILIIKAFSGMNARTDGVRAN